MLNPIKKILFQNSLFERQNVVNKALCIFIIFCVKLNQKPKKIFSALYHAKTKNVKKKKI